MYSTVCGLVGRGHIISDFPGDDVSTLRTNPNPREARFALCTINMSAFIGGPYPFRRHEYVCRDMYTLYRYNNTSLRSFTWSGSHGLFLNIFHGIGDGPP